MAWVDCGLSAARLPVLRPREVQLWAFDSVTVRTADAQWHGSLALTTHRIVWWLEAESRELALDVVRGCTKRRPKHFFGKATEFELATSADAFVLAVGAAHAKVFAETLASALARREWSLDSEPVPAGFASSRAGVSGILRRDGLRRRKAAALATDVQTDLAALMKKASMVLDTLRRYQGNDDSARNALLSLGAAPGRGKGAHALAREICDFTMQEPRFSKHPSNFSLAGAAALVSLPDVYCAFNRARGISPLVSPDDFFDACSCMASLALPLELRIFRSGAKALRRAASSASHRLSEELRDVCVRSGGLSALQAAAELDVPAALAVELLLDAEADGLLCRDDAPAGLRFFPNAFVEIARP
ncbi:EAP30/Vps36 family-domain-containing protein [Pelagophyceae sp. CCMP2097]|nr:EAP30/Vps36 family-domain-containing protein [Pelagophyceae sp. CCMP2097]